MEQWKAEPQGLCLGQGPSGEGQRGPAPGGRREGSEPCQVRSRENTRKCSFSLIYVNSVIGCGRVCGCMCAQVSAEVCFSVKVVGGRRGLSDVWQREGRTQVLLQTTYTSCPGSELGLSRRPCSRMCGYSSYDTDSISQRAWGAKMGQFPRLEHLCSVIGKIPKQDQT